jgi:hypothetical protein
MPKIKPELQAEYDQYKELNSKDDYSKAVVDFGDRWMAAMEDKMSKGQELKDIWQQTSYDTAQGITGFMYGAGAAAVAHFWEHGEELKKLHNEYYHAPADAEGVVNPAILTFDA